MAMAITGIQPDAGLGLVDSAFVNGIAAGGNATQKSTLTANPGGAQATATSIPPNAQIVRFSTVATAADSFKLPFAQGNTVKILWNDTANAAAVFARNGTNRLTSSSDTINALANGVAISIPAGKMALCISPVAGKWAVSPLP